MYRTLAITNVTRLANSKGFFRSLENEYPRVVISPSDGTYNHLTYFGKKSKSEARTIRNGARIRVYSS